MIHDPNAEYVTHTVQVARDGKPYTGTYVVEGETLTVQYRGNNKIVPLYGAEPESKARMILGEMVSSRPASDRDIGADPSPDAPADAQRPIHRDWLGAAYPDAPVGLVNDDERDLLQCLGASVLLQWNNLSNDMHRAIFETAIAVMESDQSVDVRHQLALFLHDHKDDWAH